MVYSEEHRETISIQNPIIPGFAPDASVVFSDGYYFLVTSSFHLFPGLPIYASVDLAEWKHIGNAINRPSQLDLSNATSKLRVSVDGTPMIATGGLYAPTIRKHNSRFYIVCTNVIDESRMNLQNFIISTSDIWSDEWSDPIPFDWNGIDPSLYFDEDGRAYVHGAWSLQFGKQPANTIKQVEINIETGEHISEIQELWGGFTKVNTEGPHVYKKDGFYYLVVAEGGTFEHHKVSIARARDLWGPYEAWEDNEVVSIAKEKKVIQHVGHAELFEGAGGEWWATCLGVRKPNGCCTLGRETFLMPITWSSDGWPVIEKPRLAFTRPVSMVQKEPHRTIPNTGLEKDYVYIRSPNLDDYCIDEEKQEIVLYSSTQTLEALVGTATFLGKRQRSQSSLSTATLVVPNTSRGKEGIRAGIALYKDPLRFAQLCFDFKLSCLVFRCFNRATGTDRLSHSRCISPKAEINLKIKLENTDYGFWYRLDGTNNWELVGSVAVGDLECRDFTGPIIGLYGTSENNRTAVTFRSFRVE